VITTHYKGARGFIGGPLLLDHRSVRKAHVSPAAIQTAAFIVVLPEWIFRRGFRIDFHSPTRSFVHIAVAVLYDRTSGEDLASCIVECGELLISEVVRRNRKCQVRAVAHRTDICRTVPGGANTVGFGQYRNLARGSETARLRNMNSRFRYDGVQTARANRLQKPDEQQLWHRRFISGRVDLDRGALKLGLSPNDVPVSRKRSG